MSSVCCLSFCLYVCLVVCLFVCLYVFLYVVCLSVCMSDFLSALFSYLYISYLHVSLVGCSRRCVFAGVHVITHTLVMFLCR